MTEAPLWLLAFVVITTSFQFAFIEEGEIGNFFEPPLTPSDESEGVIDLFETALVVVINLVVTIIKFPIFMFKLLTFGFIDGMYAFIRWPISIIMLVGFIWPVTVLIIEGIKAFTSMGDLIPFT